MKNIFFGWFFIACLCLPGVCLAWDGFDADTTDLVEILPDRIPAAGQTVKVRDYENDEVQDCVVVGVIRNRRTIEVVVRNPAGKTRMLVMEGR